ncbi:MAG: substrate-binding domain-containing protein [Deltaproteobacteria bacterium]
MSGFYDRRPFPSERELSAEFAVAYMTARKAVVKLIETGELQRLNRLTTPVPCSRRSLQKEFLFVGAGQDRVMYWIWYPAIERAVAAVGGKIQFVLYKDWSDPAIYRLLREPVDGIFLTMLPDPPYAILRLMEQRKGHIATLEEDYSKLGIPYLNHLPANGAESMVEYLVSLGHRRIDCFNTQPHGSPSTDQRVAGWSKVLTRHGLSGEFVDCAVPTNADPLGEGYRSALQRFRSGLGFAPAVFCTSTQTALGLNRACFEMNYKIGEDISFCALHLENAQYYTPTLTSLLVSDVDSFAERALRFLLSPQGAPQRSSLRLQPQSAEIYLGESTGQCLAPSKVRALRTTPNLARTGRVKSLG